MARSQKAEFLRAVQAFNPTLAGLPGTASAHQHIRKKISDYDAKQGGTWNYENLYRTLDSVLKGMSVDKALSFLSQLEGPGEAAAKVAIFKGILKLIKLEDSESVEVGARVIHLKNGKSVSVRPDFSFKDPEGVTCVFAYPNAEPVLKQQQREAIVNVLAKPLPLTTEPHFLLIAEYPQLGSKRSFSAERFAFEHRLPDECFEDHLSEFFEISGLGDETGDLFG